MLLIRPRRTLRSMTTINLPMLVTDLPVCFTSIVETPFFYDSNFQIPQSDLRAIPATCLFNDSSQVSLDHVFCYLDLRCDLCIRASLENKRCDSPLSTCKIHVSRQQRHHLSLRAHYFSYRQLASFPLLRFAHWAALEAMD